MPFVRVLQTMVLSDGGSTGRSVPSHSITGASGGNLEQAQAVAQATCKGGIWDGKAAMGMVSRNIEAEQFCSMSCDLILAGPLLARPCLRPASA
jgi:hypothetical protein